MESDDILAATYAQSSKNYGTCVFYAESHNAEGVASHALPAPHLRETRLLVEGMTCGSCAARIEAALCKTPGVVEASVNFAALTARVVHHPVVRSAEALLRVVEAIGYQATLLSSTDLSAARDECRVRISDDDNNAVELQPRLSSPLEACQRHQLLVEGMTCGSCAARIEQALKALPMVVGCDVCTTTGVVSVTTTTARGDAAENVEAVMGVVMGMGYGVTLQAPALAGGGGDAVERTREALKHTQEIRQQKRYCIASAILSAPLLVVMIIMSTTDFMTSDRGVVLAVDTIQLMCATPIVLCLGRQFFTRSWRSYQHGAYTMDTLVSLGTGSAYGYSLVAYASAIFFADLHMPTYFDTAGVLMTFMLLGRYLEANARRGTSEALVQLMGLVPPHATVITAGGDTVRMRSSAIEPGMQVRILAGERIPVDGTIVDGSTDIDEQLMTGESVPKHAGPGAAVTGGTLNLTATVVVVAVKVGEATVLAHILRIVQEAQSTKPAVQRVADSVAMYFVPGVVVAALATLIVWMVLGVTGAYPAAWRPAGLSWELFAFNFFIATIVVACPCALGLATPTAIMVGTGVGAQHGILVKSGATLEAMRGATCVVFDKTGTLTNGKLQVVRECFFAAAVPAPTEALVRALVALVEEQSTHPIAQAVCAALKATRSSAVGGGEALAAVTVGAEVQSCTTYAGKGVVAVVSTVLQPRAAGGSVQAVQHRVAVGSVALMDALGVAVGSAALHEVHQRGTSGHTTIVAAVDGVVRLVISLSDEPKPEARAVLRALHAQGLRTLMVTGDNRHVAACVAEAVGIPAADVRAQALPTMKASIVRHLQQEGHKVVFVGDGINDSPALAQANVGIALGAGTQVALEAADAIIMHNTLVDLLNLQKLAALTVCRIYANFVWAFGYNILMFPLASGLAFPLLRRQLPPLLAGAAMVCSSLSVLLSSLSIRCFQPLSEQQLA